MKEKIILVTGSSGFVGKHLVDRLQEDRFKVIPFSRTEGQDVTSMDDFSNLPPVDVVFHLAAIASVPLSWEKPQQVLSVNSVGTANVLEYARKVGSRVIYANSYPYGIPQYLPTDEDHPTVAENPYGISKLAAEDLCRVYASRYQLVVTSLRFFNIYGPGQSEKMIISQMISKLKRDGKITVLDGSPRRDFVFIADAVNACIKAMQKQISGFSIYNIGSGTSISIKEVAEMLIRIAKIEGVEIIDKKEQRPNEIPETRADISQARRELNWQPTVSLKEGLQITFNAA